jgi:hypothetical protein
MDERGNANLNPVNIAVEDLVDKDGKVLRTALDQAK